MANYPHIQTPRACIADFCLIPQIASVQRLVRSSGLSHSMHSAGTTIEGPWDEVMKVIGQAHSMLHEEGVVRIQTDIRVGSRTDKEQTFGDKVKAVEKLLEKDGTRAEG